MTTASARASTDEGTAVLESLLREVTEQRDAALRQLEAQREASEESLRSRDEQIERLKEQIRLLLAQRFAPSSEKVDESQLGLFNEAEVESDRADGEPDGDATGADDGAGPSGKPRRRGKRRPLPAHLPRVEVVHEVPEHERVCPHASCAGAALEVIGEEVSEQLRIVPAHAEVVVHRRPKYACPCCHGHVCVAPMPTQPIPKSMATPELLAFIATGKYVDGLPLHRQEKQLARIGVELSRQTMARWMVELHRLFTPVVNLLREALLSQTYMQMDESTFQVLKEPGRSPESQSRLWAQRAMDPSRPVVLFTYHPERSGDVARALMGEFRGIRHSDGYVVYEQPMDGVTAAHCWAHARRYFTDGLKSLGLNPKRLPQGVPKKGVLLIEGLRFIRELYAIEKGLENASDEERQQVRAEKSAKVLARMKQWLEKKLPRVRADSAAGKAMAYVQRYWDGLGVFVTDGRVRLDTNLVENDIRPFALGRKGWLFADTPSGAEASATVYTIVSTAKANGFEPYAYLRYIISRLPSANTLEDIEALLPWNLTREDIRLRS